MSEALDLDAIAAAKTKAWHWFDADTDEAWTSSRFMAACDLLLREAAPALLQRVLEAEAENEALRGAHDSFTGRWVAKPRYDELQVAEARVAALSDALRALCDESVGPMHPNGRCTKHPPNGYQCGVEADGSRMLGKYPMCSWCAARALLQEAPK